MLVTKDDQNVTILSRNHPIDNLPHYTVNQTLRLVHLINLTLPFINLELAYWLYLTEKQMIQLIPTHHHFHILKNTSLHKS